MPRDIRLVAAVAAIEMSIVRIRVALGSERARLYASGIGDAVRPGVVAVDGDSL